uniref:Uncharacterized protein n=1 Tax=Plectus sambesii TaxID=2011161 RepID=A0A914V0G1_9BILA
MPCIPLSEPDDDNFDPTDRRYRCCFQHFHIKTAAALIGLVEVSFILFATVGWTIIAVHQGERALVQLVFSAFLLIGAALLVGALLCGVYMERKELVTPHIIAQTVTIVVLFIVFSFLILGYRGGPLSDADLKRRYGADIEVIAVGGIFICLTMAFVEVWLLTVVLRCYRFLRDKEMFTSGLRVDEL